MENWKALEYPPGQFTPAEIYCNSRKPSDGRGKNAVEQTREERSTYGYSH
jgi:hypothetical protein